MTSDRDGSFNFEDEWQDTLKVQTATSIQPLMPKVGGRFSRTVIRILNDWLVRRKQNPYPNEDDIDVLQTQTGLNKTQITNWFANTRRRSRMQCVRPASPQVRTSPTDPIDILPRPGTPALRQSTKFKGPLQRWVDSPPEDEGAAIRDIACAVASSSRASSSQFDLQSPGSNENNAWRSPYYMSSASSAGTSDSGSQSSQRSTRAPRRKRIHRRRRAEDNSLQVVELPYQCTFCTETFKTKHDWQRHEKSLHLPLEQWVCGPSSPVATRLGIAGLCCIFCGQVSPDDAHIRAHNYSACSRRNLEERTFLRKDHLTQHLKLVHGARYEDWSMKYWKISKLDVRSRCGFCDIWMTSWGERVDHLAEHFKSGSTMAEWQGEWGFEDAVLKWVENSIPPYFIHFERQSPFPIKACNALYGLPINAYELIKFEMEIFTHDWYNKTCTLPTQNAMQLEACRIVIACEYKGGENVPPSLPIKGTSWLRDLIMSSADITRKARSEPMELSNDGEISFLKIHGQHYLFEQCPLESQLRVFVEFEKLMNVHINDVLIQNEACEIIRRMEKDSPTPSESFTSCIITIMRSHTDWLSKFKERSGISMTDTTINLATGLSLGPSSNQNSPWLSSSSSSPPKFLDLANYDLEDANFYRGFERDLKRWVAATMCPQNPNFHIPSDAEIQHQARWIIYNGGDAWNQTPADFVEWLEPFKRQVGISKNVNRDVDTGCRIS
ncbi:hypothetical protein B0J11DRAFT_558673 [Dendryphion nanum]|uniref:Uncharacterized protein n=1 Tax=Dendryphion nanum TaxID=256645 RepID=A0A9P9DTN5_9PLEO|nr:hypothetical protein B0J11DRAFT_558673 [Dendryphion nanum]